MNTARIVHDIAAAKDAKPGQIALAWLLHQGDDIVPIHGTKRRKYLEENVAAESIQLDAAQMKNLDDAHREKFPGGATPIGSWRPSIAERTDSA